MPRVRLLALRLVLCAAAAGCGARSGLEVEPPPPSFDAGLGRDAPARDARTPFDVPPECLVDLDCDDDASCSDDRCVDGVCVHERHDERCDDGLFCTGPEICAPGPGGPGGGCLRGAPVVCGDRIECTLDACDEALDACVSSPRTELCPVSHRCDPVLGCVARALAHDETFLFEIDLPTGELRTLGTLPVPLTDLALHPDGTLYGAGSALFSVDYEAGTFTHVADVEGSFNALDVAPDGRLYGATSSRVVRFDLGSGAVVEIARFPRGLTSSGDLAFVGDALYATASTEPGGPRPDVLVRVEVAARTATLVGSIGQRCVWGLAPFGDTLYGLTCEGRLLRIDVVSGTSEVLAMQPPRFYGAGAR